MSTHIIDTLLRLRDQAEETARAVPVDTKRFAALVKNFGDVYKKASEAEQGEYHHLYVTSLGDDHSANRVARRP
jgi:hypothetical protein